MEKSQQKRACRFPVAVAATPDATSTAAAIATAIGMSLYYLSRPKVGLRVVKKSLFPSGFFLTLWPKRGFFFQFFSVAQFQDSGCPRIYARTCGRKEAHLPELVI